VKLNLDSVRCVRRLNVGRERRVLAASCMHRGAAAANVVCLNGTLEARSGILVSGGLTGGTVRRDRNRAGVKRDNDVARATGGAGNVDGDGCVGYKDSCCGVIAVNPQEVAGRGPVARMYVHGAFHAAGEI